MERIFFQLIEHAGDERQVRWCCSGAWYEGVAYCIHRVGTRLIGTGEVLWRVRTTGKRLEGKVPCVITQRTKTFSLVWQW